MAGAAGPCVFALPVWCCAFLNTKEPSSYCIARRRSRCRRAQTRSSLIAVNSLTSNHIAFRFARRRLKFIPSHAPMPLYYTSYSRARDWSDCYRPQLQGHPSCMQVTSSPRQARTHQLSLPSPGVCAVFPASFLSPFSTVRLLRSPHPIRPPKRGRQQSTW
ncbi:hypothetical protein EDB80DRAFT_432204 [Ilyonectria destructans]|nr:hypothetical protein EDB80DRAFT_432204 [Ilyonectria destructans]